MKGLLLVAALTLFSARPHHASLEMTGAYVRSTLPGATGTAAYGVVRNRGARPRVITGARAREAQAVEFHSTTNVGGQMQMRPMARVVVPAHGELRFAPGGAHIMWIGVKRRLVAGERVSMTLLLEGGDSLVVPLRVRDARR